MKCYFAKHLLNMNFFLNLFSNIIVHARLTILASWFWPVGHMFNNSVLHSRLLANIQGAVQCLNNAIL